MESGIFKLSKTLKTIKLKISRQVRKKESTSNLETTVVSKTHSPSLNVSKIFYQSHFTHENNDFTI